MKSRKTCVISWCERPVVKCIKSWTYGNGKVVRDYCRKHEIEAHKI